MAIKLITPPTVEPITLVDAKKHLRVDHSDDDTQINLFITAARSHVERWCGRALITQTWEMTIDAFPGGILSCTPTLCTRPSATTPEIKIPLPPLQQIVSIKYFNPSGDETTLPDTEYTADTVSQPGWVVPNSSWPSTLDAINVVTIQFVAGYGDAPADIPADIRAAILLHLGTFYAQRESVVIGQIVQMLPITQDLLRDHRVQLGMA